MKKISILFYIAFTINLFAQQINLKEIMKGNEFVGNLPSNPSWSWDSKRIYFEWNPSNLPGNELYFWQKGFKSPIKASENDKLDSYVPFEFLNSQQNHTIRYYILESALYAFDTKSKSHHLVYQTNEPVLDWMYGAKQNEVFIRLNNNLFQINHSADNFSIKQITNFQTGNQRKDKKEKTFLEEQQEELFLYIQQQQQKRKWKNEQTKPLFFPKTQHIGQAQLENLQLSNNQKFVVFRLSSYPEGLETKYEQHITESGYSKPVPAREKVSINAFSEHSLGIYNRDADSVYFVDFSSLSDMYKNPSYLQLYPNFTENSKEPKAIVMHEVVFNEKDNYGILTVKSQDNKDRWIVLLDLKTGKIEELDHQHDPAWIGGPGISEWNFDKGTLGFTCNPDEIYFQSEETGYSHLYVLNTLTKQKRALTSGKWEVRDVQISSDKKSFYITCNKTHPGNRELYKLDIKSALLSPILVEEGANEAIISPDEKQFAVLFSTKVTPWELFVCENKTSSKKVQITHSTTERFNAYNWVTPEVITFEATDKTNIYARLYKPSKDSANGAAVIFVHGAGYLQNAHNHWSNYFREFMFHTLLVQKGFTVIDIDYRASDGYGRDFRTGIYRHMGGLDLQDHLDGRKYLIEKLGIDSNRIGIYGGSYGGFITLMALLTQPGKFKCGAALRAVTDWAHYNVEYTSNILNFPETDPESYKKSSPIYFAENLSDELLMLHGMVDDNVQFQDVVRLSERFIELGKTNWNLAVYPIEAHGFKESYSWFDEYRRILELFEKNLLK